jgi:hypothetical protein
MKQLFYYLFLNGYDVVTLTLKLKLLLQVYENKLLREYLEPMDMYWKCWSSPYVNEGKGKKVKKV